METIELAKKANAQLAQILDDGHESPMFEKTLLSLSMNYVYRHGVNIWHLGEDMIFMYEAGRYVATHVFIRAMLESCLLIGAAFRNSAFAAEKMLGEFERSIELHQELLALSVQKDLIEKQINFLKEDSEELLRLYGKDLGNKRWRKMNKVAEEGKMLPRYLQEYHYMSQHTHGTAEGLSRTARQVGIGNALQSGTLSINISSVLLAACLTIPDREKTVKELAADKNQIVELIKAGKYAAMDAKKHEEEPKEDGQVPGADPSTSSG